MRTLSREEVEDFLVGAKILAAGGGGEIEWARPLIEEVYSKGKQFRLVSPQEIPENEIVVIAGSIGGGVSEEMKKKVARLPRISQRPELLAARVLAEYMGRKPYAYLASEIGPANTIVPMYVAAMMDAFTVDADCCGRAKPEICISTTHIKGLPLTPLSIVSPFGDIIILKESVDDFRVEDICRYIAIISGGKCELARCPASGKDIREAVVPLSISNTIEVGRSVRLAKAEGRDPIEALINALKGYKLFEGKVKSFEREEKGAFMWGTIEIDGTGDYKNHKLKIWFKNELLVSWRDGKPFVTCPDTISVVDAKTAEGLSNWGDEYKEGREVVVIGKRAHELWRTEKGLELFSPKHFGFDIEYTPIEQIVSEI